MLVGRSKTKGAPGADAMPQDRSLIRTCASMCLCVSGVSDCPQRVLGELVEQTPRNLMSLRPHVFQMSLDVLEVCPLTLSICAMDSV